MKLGRAFSRLFGSGLIANIGATSSSQIVQLLIQLAAVPVLAHAWGLERYGIWLILFTLPSYLALGDLGFVGAAANDMTHAVAQGRADDARRTYRTLRLALGMTLLALIMAIAALVFGPARPLLDFAQAAAGGQASLIVVILAIYGLVGLYNQLPAAGLRATGNFARGVYCLSLVNFGEAVLALSVAAGGGGLVAVAAAYLAARLVGSIGLGWLMRRHAGWLGAWSWRMSSAELRRLAKPAAAMAVLPGASAISLQGMVAVVGVAAGAAAVPAFTAVRTLTRSAVQLIGIVNHASMPDFTVACATDQAERKADLAALTLMTSLLVLAPAAVGVIALGPLVIHLWTAGAIKPEMTLIAAMAVVMVFHGSWRALGNLILAMNEHHRFSYYFLLFSLLSLPLGYVLIQRAGSAGGAYAMAIADGLLLAVVMRESGRLGIISQNSILHAPARVGTMVRRVYGRVKG